MDRLLVHMANRQTDNRLYSHPLRAKFQLILDTFKLQEKKTDHSDRETKQGQGDDARSQPELSSG